MDFSEKDTVEKYILNELSTKLDWKYLTPQEIKTKRNGNLEEILLIENLRQSVAKINPHIEFSNNDLDYLVTFLKNIVPDYEGVRRMLDIIRNGLLMPIESEKKEKIVKIINASDVSKNDFIITNQFSVEGTGGDFRADIVLFINGIPVVLIECKSPTQEEADWTAAYSDIKTYEEKSPELFKYVQISLATDGEKSKYFPNSFNEEGKDPLNEWKDAFPLSSGTDPLETTVHGLLHKDNLLDLIDNFTFMKKEKDKMHKITARYMQFRAAKKIFKRVTDTLSGKDNKKFGLIWHWQGSGKTYSMAFSAWKLFHSRDIHRPSIFVVVDRKDLEEQIENDFAFLQISIEKIRNLNHLVEVLTWGDQGKRGIFLVTIEKFRPKEFLKLEKEGLQLEIKRENVIVFADEVHRTQYGKFSTMMRSIFKNAFIFGFTGTPLSKTERNTFEKFCPPKELYLDRYTMIDARNDGFTVPISYQARLPNYHLKLNQLKSLAEYEESMIESLTEEERKELHKKVRVSREFAKGSRRIKDIASNIAKHFDDVVRTTGLKAMVVAFDRESCVMYKKALDDLIPNTAEVVMSFGPKEKSPIIREFVKELQARYKLKDQKDIHDKIVENFKENPNPKILIVTDMLITGFDSPNLWTMYIDKPLKEHRVLQAVARTNRPFPAKQFGHIVDYIGILEELNDAFSNFEASDLKEMRSVVRDLRTYQEDFKSLLAEVNGFFKDVKKNDASRHSYNKVLDRFLDKRLARKYEDRMKSLMGAYEMLRGEAFLKEYLEDYTWLTKVHVAYNRRFKRANIDEMKINMLSKKTAELIRETVDIEEINEEYPQIDIDEKYVENLKKNRPKTIGAAIDVIANLDREARNHPNSKFYTNLTRQVKKAYDELTKKNIKTEEVIQNLLDISEQVVRRKQEEKELGGQRYAIYESLTEIITDINKDDALEFSTKLLQHLRDKKLVFKGWCLQRDVRRKVKAEVRLMLLAKFRNHPKLDELMDGIVESLEVFC